MRIIAISDSHKKWDFKAPDGDVFIHAGDISEFNEANDKSYYIEFLYELNKLPHKHKIIIAGNHDKYIEAHREEFEKMCTGICIYLQDSSIIIDGVKFYGSPWTKYINSRYAFGYPYNKIKEKWDMVQNKTDVLITHQAPFQIFSTSIDGRELGCRELQKCVLKIQPPLHIFGHIHYSGGNEKQFGNTLFCNVSYDKQYNNKCCVIDLDMEAKEVNIIGDE